ncbi:BQ5605_C011g06240 [Microbotryum silenes-dioicae]|uniref:BQ5605_C011g06240 protein n=1 Tax=Microbotryum silenes-dioicae TaxID=796604 RepID=A0A2X0LT01_9BASI|nr:BQ5605_C011g06240 [Microbotryum silenes-dioicae]
MQLNDGWITRSPISYSGMVPGRSQHWCACRGDGPGMVAELGCPTLVVLCDCPRSSQDGNHPSGIPWPSRPHPKAILKISAFFAMLDWGVSAPW